MHDPETAQFFTGGFFLFLLNAGNVAIRDKIDTCMLNIVNLEGRKRIIKVFWRKGPLEEVRIQHYQYNTS